MHMPQGVGQAGRSCAYKLISNYVSTLVGFADAAMLKQPRPTPTATRGSTLTAPGRDSAATSNGCEVAPGQWAAVATRVYAQTTCRCMAVSVASGLQKSKRWDRHTSRAVARACRHTMCRPLCGGRSIRLLLQCGRGSSRCSGAGTGQPSVNVSGDAAGGHRCGFTAE